MDYNSELARLRMRYETGKIDEATYLAELRQYTSTEQEVNSENSSKKKKEKVFILFAIIKEFWIPIIVFIGIIIFLCGRITPKEYEYVDDFGNLPEPVQENLLGGRVQKVAFGKNVNIIYGAEYTIYGRVVGTYKYKPTSVVNSLSPIDIGLAWGFMAQDEYDHEVVYTSKPSRFLTFEVARLSAFNGVGGMAGLGQHISNNHIIPADNKIKNLVKSVEVDDFIKLEGFLVTATPEGSTTPILRSSAVRFDGGAGACEVMYVTDIKWLKEK